MAEVRSGWATTWWRLRYARPSVVLGIGTMSILGLVLALVSAAGSPVPAAAETNQALVSRHATTCLTVEGGSTEAGARIVSDLCRDDPHQRWSSFDAGGGTVTLQVAHTGMCLDVDGASTADLTELIQWPCSGDANQQFRFQSTDAGWSTVVVQHSGKCIDVEGGATPPGARLIQFSCSAESLNQQFEFRDLSIASPGVDGAWGPVVPTPLVPVAASGLPDGNVLIWSAFDRFSFGGEQGYTETAIFNPATNASSAQRVSNTGHDMFCPGIANLADGRILVNGGSNAAETSIYNPATGTWQDAADMNIPRGYQGTTLTSTGEALTLGGSWSGGLGGKHGEVWTDGEGWRRLTGVPVEPFLGSDPQGIYREDNHLWLFGWSDGRVFHAGPSQAMHWIDTNGNGSVQAVGNRADQGWSVNGTAVMYEPGRILALGGAPAYVDGFATDQAAVIDITGSNVTSRAVGSMAQPRVFQTSTVLPSGEVVVTGGQFQARAFTDEDSVLTTEIWNPQTETFRQAAPMQVPRNYHSIALLLPDGRVMAGGGGLCGGCDTNHADVQIYSPPYLFNSDGSPAAQPRIISAPGSVDLNETFDVTTNRAVSEFVLMRMSSATHSVNNDQRRIPLGFSPGQGNLSYRVQTPADGGVAIPGVYMLFAIDGAGVPSVASVLTVTTEVAEQSPAAIGGEVSFSDGSTVAGVSIDLFEAEANDSRGAYLTSTQTDGTGQYRFDVDPGDYILTFIAPAGETFSGSSWFQPSVTVTDGEERLDINGELDGTPGGGDSAIGGTVLFTDGAPGAQVKIDLFQAQANGSRGSFLGTVDTDASGQFRFEVAPGSYVLTFVAPDGATFDGSQWFQPEVAVDPGQERLDVDATLTRSSDSSIIGGTVTNPDDSPEAGVNVDLFVTLDGGGRGQWLGSVETAADGTYQFEAPPGCYTLTFSAPPGRTFNGSPWFQPNGCVLAGETKLDFDAVLD